MIVLDASALVELILDTPTGQLVADGIADPAEGLLEGVSRLDERLRFVARLLEGEKMAPLCAEFGISRKTGYRIYDRYKECGVQGLTAGSRRPFRQANRLPAPVEARIVRLKREYPGWGAPKIREKLRQQSPALLHFPAISTVHAVLDRYGLVHHR